MVNLPSNITETVRARMNAGTAAVSDEEISNAVDVVESLVTAYQGDADIPDSVVVEAVVLAAVEKLNIDSAPNGVLNQQYDLGGDVASTPIRIGRDPLKAAIPLLDRYVSGRFFCA